MDGYNPNTKRAALDGTNTSFVAMYLDRIKDHSDQDVALANYASTIGDKQDDDTTHSPSKKKSTRGVHAPSAAGSASPVCHSKP